jgi:hypothetical protein
MTEPTNEKDRVRRDHFEYLFQYADKINMALEEFIEEEDFVINEHLKVIPDNIRLIIGGLVEIAGDKGNQVTARASTHLEYRNKNRGKTG